MNFTLKDQDATSARLVVNVQEADYAPLVEKALKNIRQKANIPGDLLRGDEFLARKTGAGLYFRRGGVLLRVAGNVDSGGRRVRRRDWSFDGGLTLSRSDGALKAPKRGENLVSAFFWLFLKKCRFLNFSRKISI